MEQWVIVQETVIPAEGEYRAELGYTIINGTPLFDSLEEASAALKETNLPLGWVIMPVTQLLPGLRIVGGN